MSSCLRILSKYRKKADKEAFMMKNGAVLLEELITYSNGKYNPIRIFSAKELNKATNNYSYSLNVIKRDGYYVLYKGYLHERPISVTKFKNEQDAKQFCYNNIVFAAQMNHKNIVKLIGCCLETQIPILVFESVEYKTLGAGRIRNDRSSNFEPLSWTNRLKIAVEIANAVAYLHVGFTRPIVSKSIKLGNILFDEECAAKLFDFTLSEVIPEGETHVNNAMVRATTGYVAPEYAVAGDYNEKSDVFCFGVLLLQLLSGKEYGEKLLCQCVKNTGENYRFDEIIDPIIVGDGLCPEKEYQLKAFSDLAFKCISESAEDRPTMVDVAKQLRQMHLSSI